MKKKINVKDFAKELISRIDDAKGIDCCSEEIKRLARLAAARIPQETLLVTWKEPPRARK